MIIDFVKREELSPSITGDAVCISCKHEFVAVAPVGTCELTCPECATTKALFKHPIQPNERWVCECSSDLFFVLKSGCMCRVCGTIANI